ncbi:MAG: hypothetical protein ACTSPY_18160 [Candidatus Helarchaeota archaeon]
MDKKQVLTQILESIKNLNLNNLMIMKSNGRLLANNFPDSAIKYIKKIILKYNEIPVNNYVKANVSGDLNLILYKISTNIFLICLTREDEKNIVKKFKVVSKKFSYLLFEMFKDFKTKEKVKKFRFIKYIVYSKVSDLGPTPIAWIPENINDQEKFEIAAKSILVLSAGIDRTSRVSMDHTASIIPFVNLDCTGLVYTFSIPSSRARGNSFDATITVLVPRAHKKLLLMKLDSIEYELKEIVNQIISGRNPTYLLESIRENIEQILNKKNDTPATQTLDNTLKQLMMSEIKKIQEKKPYSTLLY